jgi:hypothetical protein
MEATGVCAKGNCLTAMVDTVGKKEGWFLVTGHTGGWAEKGISRVTFHPTMSISTMLTMLTMFSFTKSSWTQSGARRHNYIT